MKNSPLNSAMEGIVTQVISGNQMKVSLTGPNKVVKGENEFNVKLLLAITPTVRPHQELLYGQAALNYSKNILLNQKVKIAYDPQSPTKDKDGNHLCYIYINDDLYQSMLLKKGFGIIGSEQNEKLAKWDHVQSAESEAKDKGIGVWSIDGYVVKDTSFDKKIGAVSTLQGDINAVLNTVDDVKKNGLNESTLNRALDNVLKIFIGK